MANRSGESAAPPRASPWPVFVALAVALSEIGIFLGLFPVAVGGLLLLGSSVTGILHESGYVTHTWSVLALVGGVFAVLGAGLVATQLAPGVDPVVDVVVDPTGVAGRGLAVVVAGIALVAAGAAGQVAGAPEG